MKTHYQPLALSLFAASVTAVAPAAQAQPTTAPVWAVHRAVKVKPGKTAEFTKFYATTVKRFHQARKEAGAQAGWMLSKLVIPSGEEAPYHYVSTTFHVKFPELDAGAAELAPFIEKAGSTPEKFIATLDGISTLVRRTVSMGIDAVGTVEPGDYARIDYMQPAAGKAAEYVDLEKKIFKPLQEQRMKDGIISAWSFSAALMPGGSERAYQFFTVNAVKKSEQLPRLTSGYGPEPFAKVHPALDHRSTMVKTQELRTIIRSYVMRVVDIAR
jgi:hypothetical protein